MNVLDQLIKVPALNILEMEPHVPRFVSNLLARETLAHELAQSAANARPGVAFLYSRHDFADSFVTHSIVGTEENFMLI